MFLPAVLLFLVQDRLTGSVTYANGDAAASIKIVAQNTSGYNQGFTDKDGLYVLQLSAGRPVRSS